jgi:hypothetical protein
MIATFLLLLCIYCSGVLGFQHRIRYATCRYNILPTSRNQRLFSSSLSKLASTEKSLYNKVLVKQKTITTKINEENLNKLKSFVDNQDVEGLSSHLSQWLLVKPPLPLLPNEEVNEIIQLTYQMLTSSVHFVPSIPIEKLLNLFKSLADFPEISLERPATSFSSFDVTPQYQETLFAIAEIVLSRLLSEISEPSSSLSLSTSLSFLSSLTKLQFSWKMMFHRNSTCQRSFYQLITNVMSLASLPGQLDSKVLQFLSLSLTLKVPLWEILSSDMITTFIKSFTMMQLKNSSSSRQILIVLNKLRYRLNMNEKEVQLNHRSDKEEIINSFVRLITQSIADGDADENERKKVTLFSFFSYLL